MKGRRASRVQALVAGVGAGAAVYKLLRSGTGEGGEDGEQDEEATE